MSRKLFAILFGVAVMFGPGVVWADWSPGDGHKMHFPQLPDEEGWDVNATQPIVLADDWTCSESGQVKDIHFWGSWMDIDGDGHGDVGNIAYFVLSIHEDIPDPDGPTGPGYSKPGPTLWELDVDEYAVVPIDPPTWEHWYDPPQDFVKYNDHDAYFQYNVDLTLIPGIGLLEQTAGTVYWLNISAVMVEPEAPERWGWKTSRDHHLDDCVWSFWGDLDWVELYEPPRYNEFNATFNVDGTWGGGGGTNYYGTGWYYYDPVAVGDNPWYNIWFYDNPFTYENYKQAQIVGTISSVNLDQPSDVIIAINWSTDLWSQEGTAGQPPLPGVNQSLMIGRQIILQFTGYIDPEQPIPLDYLWEFGYNPEWVSIDVWGSNFAFNGTITHECVRTSMDLAFVITGETAQPTGACCWPSGLCTIETQADCEDATGINGTYMGDGSQCANADVNGNGVDDACEILGACCYPDGTCAQETQADCEAVGGIGGTYMGDAAVCAGDADGNGVDDLCEAVTTQGACCRPDGSCYVTSSALCTAAGNDYKGDGTACLGDANQNGIDDICEGEQPELKWESPPDLQYGDDVNCTYHPELAGIPPYLLAADFPCEQTGPITDVYVYGSWYLDYLPGGDPHKVSFVLSIHEDIPANPDGGIPYSMPGGLICLIENPPFTAIPFAEDLLEGWLEPPDYWTPYPQGDAICWLYMFDVEEYDCFQAGTAESPKVYWLDVQAYPTDQEAWFGWKTSMPPWNDDAVWAHDVDDGHPISWGELIFPSNHQTYPTESADLAFAIYGMEGQPLTGACCYEDGSCVDGMTAANCVSSGGDYGGDGTSCAGSDSDQNGVDDFCDDIVTLGACCYGDPVAPSCINTTQYLCELASGYAGTWYAGQDCGTFTCPVAGACCYEDAAAGWICIITNTQADCEAFTNGAWYEGMDCASIDCPPVLTGACCWPDGSCTIETFDDCEDPGGVGGTYLGDNTVCLGDANSNNIDDACEGSEMKWFQEPDLSPNGGDVNCTNHNPVNPQYPPYLLASDFECTSPGLITEVHVFGSWYRDYLPHGDPRAVRFVLSIHEDIPADPGSAFYSRPGQLLCLIEDPPFDVRLVAEDLSEAWFEPPDTWEPNGDQICWEYIFHIEQFDCIQQGTESSPIVYWLDVQAYPEDVEAWFGWKTAVPPEWNDDAVWAFDIDVPTHSPEWSELRYPDNHPSYAGNSVDLAFQIWGGPTGQTTGACCFDAGPCLQLSRADCLTQLGTYLGDHTLCAGDGDGNGIDDACETTPFGACCLPSGQCIVTDLSNCQARNGTYLGDGSQCAGDADGNGIDDACESPPYGACCLPDGQCLVMMAADCQARHGNYLGDGTNCQGDADNNGVDDACEDPPPVGACCLDNGLCFVMPENYCLARNGHYHGDGTVCEGDADQNGIDDACEPPKGACCWPDGTCTIVSQNDCENPATSAPGVYKGDLTVCHGDADLNGVDDGCEGPDTEIKWKQPPDLSVMGMDVYALESSGTNPNFVLADDFQCTETGDILEIWVWGSWLQDIYPPDGPGSVPITLSLHDDIPDPDGPAGPLFSMPGEQLYRRTFSPAEYTVQPYMVGTNVVEEGFFFPYNSWYMFPADHNCWLYKFTLDEGEFRQTGETNLPVVYWLDVQARQVPPPAYFGWKTSTESWNDDGVYANGTDDFHGPWGEMVYPNNHQLAGQSVNLAFAILGEGAGSSCCVGRVGDANGVGGDEPTIGDCSVMIDALFISGDINLIACIPEADVNQSGGINPGPVNITIGDISVLIDYLFITGTSLGLPDCF